MRNFRNAIYKILIIFVTAALITGCQTSLNWPTNNNETTAQTNIDKSQIPSFDGQTYNIVLNNNKTYFTEQEMNLENSYYFESEFTSTSLIREKNFFKRELEYHNFDNIEIEYLIPEEANDGMPLITDDLSFSKSQSEFSLNRDSLTKIITVDVNNDKNCTYMKAVLLPQKFGILP